MKFIPLSEGAFSIDKTKVFVPFNKEADKIEDRPKGSLLVEIQPFVVITNDDIILLDTGLGYEVNGELQIHTNLRNAGIDPGDVTKVLLSHLHKDHAGGISYVKDGMETLSFPSATYFVYQKELEFASGKESLSYIKEDFNYLASSSKLVLLEGEGTLGNTIRYEVSAGHSPHHMVFWIEEEEKTIFFGGDVAPQHQQMKNKFIAKYDFDGRKSMELREAWWKQGTEEHWTFLFYHDIKTPSVAL